MRAGQHRVDQEQVGAHPCRLQLEERPMQLQCLDEDARSGPSPALDVPGFGQFDGVATTDDAAAQPCQQMVGPASAGQIAGLLRQGLIFRLQFFQRLLRIGDLPIQLLPGVLELLGEPRDAVELGLGEAMPVLQQFQRSVPGARRTPQTA